MVRHAVALGIALGLGVLHDPSCGDVDSSSGGVNAPCTRDHDCAGGLSCRQGVCTDPDAAAPADDGGDAAADAGHD